MYDRTRRFDEHPYSHISIIPDPVIPERLLAGTFMLVVPVVPVVPVKTYQNIK